MLFILLLFASSGKLCNAADVNVGQIQSDGYTCDGASSNCVSFECIDGPCAVSCDNGACSTAVFQAIGGVSYAHKISVTCQRQSCEEASIANADMVICESYGCLGAHITAETVQCTNNNACRGADITAGTVECGSTTCATNVNYQNVQITASTGDVTCYGINSCDVSGDNGNIQITASTGDVTCSSHSCLGDNGNIQITASTGDVTCSEFSCDTIGDKGNIEITASGDVTCSSGSCHAKGDNGNIQITASGDVTCSSNSCRLYPVVGAVLGIESILQNIECGYNSCGVYVYPSITPASSWSASMKASKGNIICSGINSCRIDLTEYTGGVALNGNMVLESTGVIKCDVDYSCTVNKNAKDVVTMVITAPIVRCKGVEACHNNGVDVIINANVDCCQSYQPDCDKIIVAAGYVVNVVKPSDPQCL